MCGSRIHVQVHVFALMHNAVIKDRLIHVARLNVYTCKYLNDCSDVVLLIDVKDTITSIVTHCAKLS